MSCRELTQALPENKYGEQMQKEQLAPVPSEESPTKSHNHGKSCIEKDQTCLPSLHSEAEQSHNTTSMTCEDPETKVANHHHDHSCMGVAQNCPPLSHGEENQSTPKTLLSCEESNTNAKNENANCHYSRSFMEAAQNSLPSSHCEGLAYIEHFIKLMGEQQKQQQDQLFHMVQQLLDKQKESFEQLLHLEYDRQGRQHEVLLEILLHLKENQNQQVQLFTDFLQQNKNMIEQQNDLIYGQCQKEFEAKLMADVAKQTEEQVKVLLQAYNKCETHRTSNNDEFPLKRVHADTAMQTRGLFNCEPIGKQFCEQFYPLWNSQNPSYKQTGNIVWGPHLFWENATADFLSEHSNAEIVQHFEGFQCVSDFLLSLTNQERLDFRPCIDNEKFKCANSKHGLVVVAVTGTIFREETCVGIFQQTFGLIQCPEANSLKIKFANLKIKYYINHMENAIAAPNVEFTTEQLENMS
ncbi:uncharacterized protein [Pyxicephalus adspersus]|uniref:uncharacterized protein isoform X2 n=1 Tax=Pyxicephalus adspersus TaxID=30357 RepID=UPI003B5B17F3